MGCCSIFARAANGLPTPQQHHKRFTSTTGGKGVAVKRKTKQRMKMWEWRAPRLVFSGGWACKHHPATPGSGGVTQKSGPWHPLLCCWPRLLVSFRQLHLQSQTKMQVCDSGSSVSTRVARSAAAPAACCCSSSCLHAGIILHLPRGAGHLESQKILVQGL